MGRSPLGPGLGFESLEKFLVIFSVEAWLVLWDILERTGTPCRPQPLLPHREGRERRSISSLSSHLGSSSLLPPLLGRTEKN